MDQVANKRDSGCGLGGRQGTRSIRERLGIDSVTEMTG